jgi:four helix bundle protein
MSLTPDVLRARTKQFAIRVVKLFQALPARQDARVLGNQLLRSGTSVAANYCAACRARSRAEFVAKLGIVIEEADETIFWLEMLADTGIVKAARLEPLTAEAGELVRIFAAARTTTTNAGKKSQITNRKSQMN